jgi:hypothetical protein
MRFRPATSVRRLPETHGAFRPARTSEQVASLAG